MSGLGELTFLQLSTTYAPASVAGCSVRCVLSYAYIGSFERVHPPVTLRRVQERQGLSVHSCGGKSEVWVFG
jgi:hypothetical protein